LQILIAAVTGSEI